MQLPRFMKRGRYIRVAFLLVLSAAVGCGGQAHISGKVSYDGKPVRWGTVMAIDTKAAPHYGEIQEDGSYVIRNVPVGLVRLSVHSPNPSNPIKGKPPGKPGAEAPPKSTATPDKPDKNGWFPIPEEYTVPDKSGLSLELGRGGATFDINLKPVVKSQ